MKFDTPPAIVREDADLSELAARINAEHEAGESATRRGLEHYRSCGEYLIKAKAACRHGEWLNWLRTNVRVGQRQAYHYIELAKVAVTATLESEWQRIQGNAPHDEPEPETPATNGDLFRPRGEQEEPHERSEREPSIVVPSAPQRKQLPMTDGADAPPTSGGKLGKNGEAVTLTAWKELPLVARREYLSGEGEGKFNQQGDNPNIEWALWSWNPVTGCLHECPYCLTPDTPVVTYDGERVPIGDVRVGDVLRGFTEYARRDARMNERAVVEAVVRTRQPVCEIETSLGVIRCSPDHRWLVFPAKGLMRDDLGGMDEINRPGTKWLKTKKMYRGQFLLWWDERLPHSDLAIEGNPFVATPIPILDVRHTNSFEDMVDIQTSSRTFLADGFATHNCYARDIANRFYEVGFQPALWPGRLAAPKNTPFPEAKAREWMGHKNVFTCSMADLFGRWVPREWIDAVLQAVADAPQWNFLFLTKFPLRLSEFEFPDNAWVGTSVDCQIRVANAERAFRKVKAKVKWLSIEPMIEPLTFSDLAAFQWIVLGGASASSQTPEWHPPREWVRALEDEAARLGVAFYEKDNLHGRVRGYPGQPGQEPTIAPEQLRYLPEVERR